MRTTLELTERFEDRREIKNLMGKYVASLILKREGTIFADFWSKAEDVCLGFNHGYYKGADAITGYYAAVAEATRLKGKALQKKFPEQLGSLSDEELYGTGPYEAKPLTSPYIVEAEDQKTAKGLWMVQGIDTDITTAGPVTYWTWGYFAADFIKEDGGWKIWHLQYVEDVHHLSGQNWGAEETPYPELPEFSCLKDISIPAPNVPATVREYYSADRNYTAAPQIPVAYSTFAETFSYGV